MVTKSSERNQILHVLLGFQPKAFRTV